MAVAYKVEPLRGSVMALLEGNGFSRYHAARQVAFDKRGTMFGCVMYIFICSSIWSATAEEATVTSSLTSKLSLKLSVVALMLENLWAVSLHSASPDAYLKWRDPLFLLHFLIQHAISPWIVTRIGIDVRKTMAVGTPAIFFLNMLISRTILWTCLNVLMYRVKLRSFLIWQPLILAATLPLEIDMCQWAAEKHTEITITTFGTLRAWGRVVMAAGTPGAILGIAGEGGEYNDAYGSCLQMQSFTMIVLDYIVPAFIIWYLEGQAWQSFMRADPRSLMWRGGPSENDIHTGQLQLRYEEAGRASERGHLDHRVGAILYIGSVVAWHLLEFLIVYI